jgi:hypothetical protein
VPRRRADGRRRVATALAAFGAPADNVEQVRALGPDEFLFLGAPPARVDILRAVPGVAFAEAHARREQVTWDGVPRRGSPRFAPFSARAARLKA